MKAAQRRRLRWFKRWERLGYTATYQSSGHYRVLDADGVYVATISGSPSNPKAPEFEVDRILRRHEQDRSKQP